MTEFLRKLQFVKASDGIGTGCQERRRRNLKLAVAQAA